MAFKVLYQKSSDSYLGLSTFSLYSLNESPLDLPGGPVVKNPPANAGDMDLIPGLGRFHVPQGHWARERQVLKPEHLEPCSAPREARAMRSLHTTIDRSPCSGQLEKAWVQQQRPSAAWEK